MKKLKTQINEKIFYTQRLKSLALLKKWLMLPKAICRFQYRDSNGIFIETEQMALRSRMESQETPRAKAILRIKNSWRHHTSSYSSKQYAIVHIESKHTDQMKQNRGRYSSKPIHIWSKIYNKRAQE